MVDFEQKSERLQSLLVKIISNLIRVNQNFETKTQSFLFYVTKLESLSPQSELSIGNSGFKLSKILEAQNSTVKIFILKVI